MRRIGELLLPWATGHRLLSSIRAFAGFRFWRAIGLVAAGAVLEGTGLILLVPILTLVTAAPAGGAQRFVHEWIVAVGPDSIAGRLAILIGIFALVMIVRAAILYARDTALARLQTGYIQARLNAVIAALAAAPWARIAALRHARVSHLTGAEIQRLGGSVNFMIQGGVATAMLAIQAAIALVLAPALAAVVLLILAGSAATLFLTQRRARDLGVEVVQASQSLAGSAASFLGGLKIAAAQNSLASFVAEFESIHTQLRSRQLSFLERQAWARMGFGLASLLLGSGVVFAGLTIFQLAPTILIVLVVVFVRMSGPALTIQQSAQNFFFSIGSFEAIEAILADLRRGPPAPAMEQTPLPQGAIEFRSVSFLHPGGGGLRDISLTIAPGEFLGVTGPSGAGKTTLVDLLVGLIAPEQGEIRVGGVPLDAANARRWQSRIAYVAQDPFLFHDTIRRNLVWDAAEIADDAIARALDLAGASELVARLPEGLETIVGERGALLSGGERQRLGLARAILRDADLMVLDEATNALDNAGETKLLSRLAALSPRPTIVLISHHATGLVQCDRVVRIANARLAATDENDENGRRESNTQAAPPVAAGISRRRRNSGRRTSG